MKLFLDDADEMERPTPKGWVRCRWPEEVVAYLKAGNVEAVSLDHDLGEEGYYARTGYDVLKWIEKEVFLNGFNPPAMFVHSQNSVARTKMLQAIISINKMVNDS